MRTYVCIDCGDSGEHHARTGCVPKRCEPCRRRQAVRHAQRYYWRDPEPIRAKARERWVAQNPFRPRVCRDCGAEFSDARSPRCADCRHARELERKAAYRNRNREVLRAAGREYMQERLSDAEFRKRQREYQARRRRENPGALDAIRQRFRERHPGYEAERMRDWRARNPDLDRTNRLSQYWRNPERAREKARRWAAENCEKVNANTANRRARLQGATGNVTTEEWLLLCAEFDDRCAYCGTRGRLTRDHVIPLARGGTHDISNIVPACQSCNSSKGAKTAEEFVGVAA